MNKQELTNLVSEILSQMKFENIIFNNAIQEDINEHTPK
jgi:hypothetical protein